MKLPQLNIKQLNRLSEIYMGIGHISLGSILVPAIIDRFNPVLLLLGLVIMFAGWFLSLRILRR